METDEAKLSAAETEIAVLRAALERIASIAGEFDPDYPEPADALAACEDVALRALGPN